MITLDETEQLICLKLAELRNKHNREANIKDQHVTDKMTGLEIDIEGIGAEMAFCKIFNLYPDLTTNPRSGGYDALSKKGYRIDIKTTKYPHGHLLVKRTKKKGESDLYCLMVGKFPSFRFAGFVTEDELFQEENIKSLGSQPGFAIEQNKLHQV